MTLQAAHIERPVLTMPAPEAQALRSAYQAAHVILEYGSGGSTVMAAEMPGKHVTSVESDRKWARMMKRWFEASPAAEGSTVDIIWSNIGKTRDWGHPVDDSEWRRFADYPLSVWKRKDFRHPDVVLVDGRFRVGCALGTAFSITRPVTLLFDDYARRKWFHRVEEFIGAPRLIGRMGVFDVQPTAIPAAKLMQIFRYMTRP